ncbi:MAG TPA: protein kinase [Thermoanaerobaculia bacterium]|nr:protein kinase [Thermoanaerobaculia bacterium]
MALRISFGARVFAMTALLVTLAVGAAVVVTYIFGNQVAHDTARQALSRASSVQAALQQQRQEQLKLIAQVFVSDPALRAYIVEAVSSGNSASVLDLLEERQNTLGYDFAMVLDPQGHVLTRTDNPNASGEDLSQRPLIRRAQQALEATGFWRQDKRLFNAVAVPLSADNLLTGFLVAGFAIDNEAADEVRKVSDADVAILANAGGTPQVVATTLGPTEVDELLAALQQRHMVEPVMQRGQSMEQVDLMLHGRRWIGLLRPLADAGGTPVGAVVSLASLDAQLLPFQRIETLLLMVGLAAILLALISSFLLGRRVFKPVRDLARAAQAASQGNYTQKIAIGRGDEVGKLAESFNHLLSELREKQDMETYIGELSRTLPSQNGHAAMEEAGTRPVALLAIDLRRYAQPKIGYDPEATMEQLAQDMRRVHAAVGSRQGQIEGAFGQRLLVSFTGDNRAFRALSAAAEIGATLSVSRSAFEEAEPPVLALTEGEAVTGSVVWGEGPERMVVGRPLLQLEGLLREGAPGDLVLSQPLYGSLGEVFTRSGVELPAQRGVFGGAQTLYVLNGEMATRVTGVSGASVTKVETGAPTQLQQGTKGAPAAPRERATLAEIAPGKVLGDRFEILSTLGAGGMGVVYKVRDRELDDLVALKMLKRELWGDRELLDRLKSELKLARKITHPNVLRTFDFGDVDGIPFITMEYVRGITLRYLLSQTGALPYSAGLRLARQLCRGLAAAHEVGVLHRDIKPENLIVMPNGDAKLMDFGIARPISRMEEGQTQPGTVVGTPQYLAPEQLQGKPIDERADLWAVGVVLYELFTSRTPFSGDNPMQVIVATLNEAPTPPRTYWAEMPEQLEQIILRCLARDPSRRYRTAGALLADLEELRA